MRKFKLSNIKPTLMAAVLGVSSFAIVANPSVALAAGSETIWATQWKTSGASSVVNRNGIGTVAKVKYKGTLSSSKASKLIRTNKGKTVKVCVKFATNGKPNVGVSVFSSGMSTPVNIKSSSKSLVNSCVYRVVNNYYTSGMGKITLHSYGPSDGILYIKNVSVTVQ